MDLDQGVRHPAGLVLDAAGRGHHDQVADLIAPLDVDQLRSLVMVLAVQVDQAMPASSGVTGPAAVCELAINSTAPMFGTTPEAILSAERSRPVRDARAMAMTVARQAGLSLPSIAEHFNKGHGSVIHAVRRTVERPRLPTPRPVRASTSTAGTPPDSPDRTRRRRSSASTSNRRRRRSSPMAGSSMLSWRPQRHSVQRPMSSRVPIAAARSRTLAPWP